MKRDAVVEKTYGECATVSFLREEACAACAGRHLCASARTQRAEVKNPVGADVGDTVEIETDSKSLLLYSAILFLAPVLLALVLYLVFIDKNKTLAYSMTAVGFIVPYVFAWLLNRKNKDALPVITAVKAKAQETRDEPPKDCGVTR